MSEDLLPREVDETIPIIRNSHFEMVVAVLERLGAKCNSFLRNLNKHREKQSQLARMVFSLPPECDGKVPTRCQLEQAAYKISDYLTWEYFASRIRKIDKNCSIFKQDDQLLRIDLQFYDFHFPCSIPAGLKESDSFKRARFARRLEQIEGVPVACDNLVDGDLLPRHFSYIKSNLYCGEIPKIALGPVVGCQCLNCGEESANCCPKMAGSEQFPYCSQQLNTLKEVEKRQAIYECTALCKCPPTCPNRVVQNGLRLPLLLFKTNNRGWGLKSLASLHKGQFVIEFCGEVCEMKPQETPKSQCLTFALDFNEDQSAKYMIDASRFGNLARFINSRCGDANLIAQAVFVDCVDSNLPRIAFFARRHIPPNEELTFDYFEGLSQSGQTCLCGSPFCRQKAPICTTPRLSSITSRKSKSIASLTNRRPVSIKRKLDDSGFCNSPTPPAVKIARAPELITLTDSDEEPSEPTDEPSDCENDDIESAIEDVIHRSSLKTPLDSEIVVISDDENDH